MTVALIDSYQDITKGSRYTDAQRKANWDAMFAGHRVRWAGVVQDVTEMLGGYSVHMKCGPTALGSDTIFSVNPVDATSFCKGQVLTIEGTLDYHGFAGYGLSDVVVYR